MRDEEWTDVRLTDNGIARGRRLSFTRADWVSAATVKRPEPAPDMRKAGVGGHFLRRLPSPFHEVKNILAGDQAAGARQGQEQLIPTALKFMGGFHRDARHELQKKHLHARKLRAYDLRHTFTTALRTVAGQPQRRTDAAEDHRPREDR